MSNRSKRRHAIYCVTLLSLMVVSCSRGEVNTGQIYFKNYEPDYYIVTPITTSCGNGCVIVNSVLTYVPPCYRLDIRDNSREYTPEEVANGDPIGQVCVTKEAWESLQIGQYYSPPVA